MDEEKRLAAQRGEIFEQSHLLAPSGGKGWLVVEKKRHVGAERGGELVQFFQRQRRVEQFVERGERHRRVGAAAADAPRQRQFFFEMDADAVGDVRGGEKRGGGAVDKVFRVGRQFRMAARKLQAGGGALKGHLVAEVDRLHDGLQFVKTVGAFAEDVQDEVDLAGRFFFEAHCHFRKAKRANRLCWRVR